MNQELQDQYKKFCSNLQKRRYKAGQTQSQIAREAECNTANIISMIETSTTKMSISKGKDLARAYKVPESFFLQALLKTRYPEFWEIFLTIVENEKELCGEPREIINNNVDKFIQNIPKY